MASISKIKIGSDEREIWAVRLKTASTIKLTGSVTGSISFDGSGGDVVINTSTNHTHSYLPLSGGTLTGNPTVNKKGARYIATNGTNSVWFGINEAGTTWGIYDATNEKYIVQSDGTNIKLNGNAATATKVNKTLTVKLNGGTTEGTNMFTFDGSAEKVVNITPSSIGAAASSHGTHVSYGTSAAAVGTAASAGTASTVSRSDHVHNLTKATVVAALGYTPPTSNTTYSAGAGLTLDGTTFKHSNSVTAATASGSATKTLAFGGTFALPTVSYDAQGHVTGSGTTTMTMPSDRLFVTLVPTGTSIPANADLNTTTYMKVGRYFCSQTANAKTLQNCPVDVAFMMEVYSPLSTTIDNETTGTWVYRIRKITAYNTGMQFIQYASVGNTANTWTYGAWKVQPIANFTLDTSDKNGGSALTGSATKPIYLKADGTFAACTYSLNTDVPSDAKFTDTVYTHPTSSGNKHIPSGGSSGQILRWSADGTAVWDNDNNTTYSAGTGLTLDGTTFKVTTANVSTMMNLLGEGTSPAQQNDYLIAQYAGGGTTTTTYHRRKISNIITADNVKKALGTGTGTTKYLREDGTWVAPPDSNSAHSHSAGVGLTGSGNAGTSGTYTYKVNLVNEAVASNAASYTAGGSSKFYAVQLDKNNKLGVYVPWSNTHAVSSVNNKTGAVTLDYSDVGASKAITGITRNGTTFTATHLDGTTTTFTQQDNNTTYSVMTAATASAAGKSGLVPAPAAGKQGQFLRGDGTWATPTNTTYTAMTGATSSAAGKSGLVPAPAAGKQNSFLRGDGAWATPTNTTYTFATGDSNGQIKVTPSGGTAINVSVKGLGSAAYTASTAYDAAGAANTALANAKTYTDTKVAALVDSAPSTLDTLNELAAALGDDPNFATTIATQIGNKANSSVTITAGNGLTGGGNLTTSRTIAVGAGAGISVTADAVALATSGVTKGSYGPSANVTGSSGATVNIPYITVDEYGRVTAASTKTYTTMTVDSAMSASSTNPVQNKIIKSYIDGKIPNLDNYLPRSAGVNYPLTGALGLTKDVMYGPTLPSTNTFDGQLFFLEDNDVALPVGGSAGQALVKNTTADGDASWKNSSISWTAGTTAGPKPNIFGVAGSAIPTASASASGIVTTDVQTFAGAKTFNNSITLSTGITGGGMLHLRTSSADGESSMSFESGDTVHWVVGKGCGGTGTSFAWWNNVKNSNMATLTDAGVFNAVKVTGAVWNDYAEFRAQKEIIEPGYCVASSNNGQVYKTTEKFQACDGIVSDTFGFAIGETDECKTPLAVAGRVLAYCEGDRYSYHAGDTVCAGPEGKVMRMTREEIREWPDRIIGIVSEIPEYKIWGTGNVEVNGRIWIKVK